MAEVEFFSMWIEVLITLLCMSFLWRDNIGFRLIIRFIIGVGAANGVLVTYNNLQGVVWAPLMAGQFIVIIPVILGLLLFARLIPKYSWAARYPVCFSSGVGLGLMFGTMISAQFKALILQTITELVNAVGFEGQINAIIVALGFVTSISYFLFTVGKNSPILKASSKLGRYFMCVCFGLGWQSELVLYFSAACERFIILYAALQSVLGF